MPAANTARKLTPNTTLADEVLAYIEAFPEDWDQESYVCETVCGAAFCFAGHTVRIAHPGTWFLSGSGALVVLPGERTQRLIPTVARELLGLSPCDASTLFAPVNSLDDLRRMVAEMHRPDFDGFLHLGGHDYADA